MVGGEMTTSVSGLHLALLRLLQISLIWEMVPFLRNF